MNSPESLHHSFGKLTTLIEVRNMSLNATEIPLLIYEEPGNRYWGVADKDVPILIGAAVGELSYLISCGSCCLIEKDACLC